jgi:nucleoside-diphosphate-sugar epimerase
MKKILIVGGGGFLGSNLSRSLRQNGFDITLILKKKEKKHNFVKGKIKRIYCDILDIKKLKNSIKNHYDVLINCSGNIDHSNKKQTLKSHHIGTRNLVKIAEKRNLKLFIQIGSSLEYGNLKSPQKEKIISKPTSIYGKAKYLASQEILNSKLKKFLILRLYQVYGPYQKSDRLVPYVINSCLKSKKFPCSSGEQLRDFLFIQDFTVLINRILRSKKKYNSGIYNVGTQKPHKVKHVINLIKKLVNKGNPNFGEITMRKEEQLNLYPNIKKIISFFNWKPKTTLANGLKKTIKFYKNNKEF